MSCILTNCIVKRSGKNKFTHFRLFNPLLPARAQIFAVDRRQLVNFLPLASIPQSLGGTLLHKHVDWLRTCFERLGAVAPSDDYFNPMKALLSPTHHYLSSGAMATRRRVSFHQVAQQQHPNLMLHHFPHQRLSNGAAVNRTNSIEHARREPLTWTYNRLLHPDTINSNNSGNRLSISDDDDDNTAPQPPTNSPTRISVAQFLAEFQRKFPLTFEREFETTIRQVGNGGTCSTNGPTAATRFSSRVNWPKNRYVDVPCYDHSAVPLPNDAYIHANFVDGYRRKKAYILTQGEFRGQDKARRAHHMT